MYIYIYIYMYTYMYTYMYMDAFLHICIATVPEWRKKNCLIMHAKLGMLPTGMSLFCMC